MIGFSVRSVPRRAVPVLVVGLALSVFAGGQASAASIVYTKDGNVWIANPDGSGQYQVTPDGSPTAPYLHASQSDDGTIVANRGQQLFVLRQNGAVVRTIDTTFGNSNPEISPDGLLIAHEAIRNACGFPVKTACNTTMVRGIDGTERYWIVGGYEQPAWIGNNNLVLTSGGPWSHVIGGSGVTQWPFEAPYTLDPAFSPTSNVGDTTATPAGDKFAYVADSNKIALFSGTGPAPAQTAYRCKFSATGVGPFEAPSWSSDGTQLAWGQPGTGIWTVNLGPTLDASTCTGRVPTLAIPGGSQPDWGPANVNPGPRQTTPSADPGGSGSGPGSAGGKLVVTLTSPKSGKLTALRAKGLKVATSFSIGCRGVVALIVPKSEAFRLKIGKTETVIAQVGPAPLEAGAFTATLKVKARYLTALKRSRSLTAVVASTCVVGSGQPVVKLKKVVFRG